MCIKKIKKNYQFCIELIIDFMKFFLSAIEIYIMCVMLRILGLFKYFGIFIFLLFISYNYYNFLIINHIYIYTFLCIVIMLSIITKLKNTNIPVSKMFIIFNIIVFFF